MSLADMISISNDEVKAYLRIDDDSEDTLIPIYINAVIGEIDEYVFEDFIRDGEEMTQTQKDNRVNTVKMAALKRIGNYFGKRASGMTSEKIDDVGAVTYNEQSAKIYWLPYAKQVVKFV